MLDLGWTELLLIGVVALIVIGPRDLPGALHSFGKFVGRLRAMAREFQSGIDDIAHQQDLRELQQSMQQVSSPKRAMENYIENLDKTEERKPDPATIAAPDAERSDNGSAVDPADEGGKPSSAENVNETRSEEPAPADRAGTTARS
ncbi:MAG TPA: Sec-independent protein translocase protein TatB [Alphaproteobacteria bacterium]|nr:Sec-independent protein translocase protein TatB [Alphaproteobacteria bacterium]